MSGKIQIKKILDVE